MKTIRSTVMLFAVVLAIGSLAAWAADHEIADWYKVSFPHQVHISNLTLPAGTYVFEQMPGMQASQNRGTFKIWHNGKVVGLTTPARSGVEHSAKTTTAKVVHIDGQSYLKQINPSDSNHAWNFLTINQLHKLQRQHERQEEEEMVAVETIHPSHGRTAQQESMNESAASARRERGEHAGSNAIGSNAQNSSPQWQKK